MKKPSPDPNLARRRFLQLGLGSTALLALGTTLYQKWPRTGHEGHDHSGADECDPTDGHDHSLCGHDKPQNIFEKRPRKIDTKGAKKLVILELTGGNDLFDTCIPIEGVPQQIFEKARPNLIRNKDTLLRLSKNPGYALPPQLETLHRLVEEQKACILQFERNGGYRSDWLLRGLPERKAISLWQSLPDFLQTRNHPTGGIPFNPAQQHPLASRGWMPGPGDSVEAAIIRQAHEMFAIAKKHQDKYLGDPKKYRAEPGEALSIIIEAIAETTESNIFYTCQTGYAATINYMLNRNITLMNLDQAVKGFVEDPDNLDNVTLALISPNSRSMTLDKDGIPETNNRFGHVIVIGLKNPETLAKNSWEQDLLRNLAESSLS